MERKFVTVQVVGSSETHNAGKRSKASTGLRGSPRPGAREKVLLRQPLNRDESVHRGTDACMHKAYLNVARGNVIGNPEKRT